MKASLDELNRVAERLLSTEGELDQRVSLAAEVRRPDFVARVAAPAGAFLADGIIQTFGVDAYRAALVGRAPRVLSGLRQGGAAEGPPVDSPRQGHSRPAVPPPARKSS